MRLPDGEFLLLVDASAYAHRAYHVHKKVTLLANGRDIGMIIGFCWSMMRLFRLNSTALKRRPSHGAIILDSRGKNFRHEIYPLYKAQRPAYEAGLEAQLPMLPEVARAFNIPCIMVPGFEADDVIATYAKDAERAGMMTVIASSDKDLMQLVSDDVLMYDALADKDADRFDNAGAIIGPGEVFKKFKVWPHQMADFLALKGDAVDNIPGVPSIGDKKASALLNIFPDVATLISEAEWSSDRFPNAKDYARIVEHLDDLRLSRRLVELDTQVPLTHDLDDLRMAGADMYTLKAFFRSIEAPQLERRVDF